MQESDTQLNIVIKDKYTNIEIENYKKQIEENFIIKEKTKTTRRRID